jgi:hypothetical protein
MNCHDFEAKITDLARGQMMDAEARDGATAHAADCGRCTARLRDEQRLTAGLREWAATFDGEQMPARGEAQLLAAFRDGRTVTHGWSRAHRWRWAAAAAVLIALMALAAMRFVEARKPQPFAGHVQPRPEETNSAPSPVENHPAAPSPDQHAALSPVNPSSMSPEHALIPHHHRRPAPRSMPSQVARHTGGDASSGTTQSGAANAAANGDGQAKEIATSFISLAGGRDLAAAESLQLVRVELPRSALVSFGLPMNVERADQRIKADVLVGNDGIARAIRFVR